MKAKITYRQLCDNLACPRERGRFRRVFGGEVVVTIKLARRHAFSFSWMWAANVFLSYEPHKQWHEIYDKSFHQKIEDRLHGRLGGHKRHLIRQAEAFARLYIAQERAKSRV